LYWIAKLLAGPALRVVYRPWITGRENLPRSGPGIVASNHLAVIDSFFLPAMVRRKITFLGKGEYVTGRGFKGRVVAMFMRGVGLIPVERGSGRAAQAALETSLKVLEDGELFGIYPEGTRSPDGRLYRGKTGIARLALRSGAPVIPVAMVGTNVAQPIGQRLPNHKVRCGIRIGEPLDFSAYRDRAEDRQTLREVTDRIMAAIGALSGQEYVDLYAQTMKARLAQQGSAA
jgi:1-acyl-sn-glycerol-3-phosphate acyltransferase